jgi:signal transduction histidine kinase
VRAQSRRLEQKSRELEAATAELRAANARLQELDRLKDEFMSTVTHELRTPLTSIRAVSEILLDAPEVGGEERQRFLAIIVKETERLTRLINQTLDMARIESGSAEWHATELDVREVVRDAVEATSQLFREKQVRIQVVADADVPPVRSDRDRLMQVLLNLLANAVKFTPAGDGRVEVRIGARPEAVQVDVRDNGPGVPPEHQDAIFERFKQLGDTPQGSGLGLAISRRIVERFGGRLWVESAVGEGSTFSFTLPLDPRRPAGVEVRRAGG